MKDSYKNTLLNAVYGLLIIVSIPIFYEYSELLFVIMMVLSLLVLKNNNIRHAPIYWVVGGIVFPLCEAFCIYFGVWAYTFPNIIGIPLWLCPAWAAVIVMVRKGNTEIFRCKTEIFQNLLRG